MKLRKSALRSTCLALATLTLAAVVLTACGGDAPSSSSSSSTSSGGSSSSSSSTSSSSTSSSSSSSSSSSNSSSSGSSSTIPGEPTATVSKTITYNQSRFAEYYALESFMVEAQTTHLVRFSGKIHTSTAKFSFYKKPNCYYQLVSYSTGSRVMNWADLSNDVIYHINLTKKTYNKNDKNSYQCEGDFVFNPPSPYAVESGVQVGTMSINGIDYYSESVAFTYPSHTSTLTYCYASSAPNAALLYTVEVKDYTNSKRTSNRYAYIHKIDSLKTSCDIEDWTTLLPEDFKTYTDVTETSK